MSLAVWQSAAMTTFAKHHDGDPCWIDTAVASTEERERLMAFYTALFGWTWDVGGEEMGYYSIAHADGKPVMGIGQGMGGEGQYMVYFRAGDIRGLYATAATLGGTGAFEPMEVGPAGTMAIVNDPAGAAHGLWQPGEFEGFGVMHEPNAPGWFDHESDAPGAAVAYYEALLGVSHLEPGPGAHVLARGEQWFASVSPNQDGRRTRWQPIFVVDSLGRAREVAKKEGGTVLVEEQDVPGTKISYFSEPVKGEVVCVMAAGQQP